MLKMSKGFVARMVVWSMLVLYLICDFFVFTGPLKRELKKLYPSRQKQSEQAVVRGICAKVFNGPIYLTQVDRRVRERLWRTGRNPEKVGKEEWRMLRWGALNEIIDEHLMRIKVNANRDDVPVSAEEVDAEVQRFESRFASAGELDKAMALQGIESRKELRYRLAARLQQEKYVLGQIGEPLDVGDEEAREWYEKHQEKVKMPERRRARHIFLATLDHPSEEAKATLAKHLADLKAGKIRFGQLAAEVSEDGQSKTRGGDLNWMRKERLPGDFAAAVFEMPVKQPQLIRTKLGWHIVEVMEVKPPELLPFEQMKEEIVAAIANSRRADAVKQYRHQLRLIHHEKVEIFGRLLNE